MENRLQVKIFAMGAAVLLTLASSVGLMVHAFLAMRNRGGGVLFLVSLLIAVGYFFVDYVQWWAMHWCTSETDDHPVIFTSFGAAFLLALTMACSGGAVMIHYVIKSADAAAIKTKQQADKEATANDISKDQAKVKSAIESDQQFAVELRQLQASGATQATINRLIAARQRRQEQELLAAQSSKPLALTSALPTADTAPKVEAEDIGQQMLELLNAYAQFWVFIVPTLMAVFCKFAVILMLILPGGASYGKTSDGQDMGILPTKGEDPNA